MKVSSNMLSKSTAGKLDALCTNYAYKLREREDILITIYHPQGCSEGVSIEGKTVTTQGKLSTIDLKQMEPRNKSSIKLNPHDEGVYNQLLKDPAAFIVSTWKEERRLFGPLSTTVFGSPLEKLDRQKQSMRVLVTRVNREDVILQKVRWSIKSFVRAHIVSKDFFSSVTDPIPLPLCDQLSSQEIAEAHNLTTLLPMLIGDPAFSDGVKTLPTTEYAQSLAIFSKVLNEQQHVAVTRALSCSHSVITGPPGTGM